MEQASIYSGFYCENITKNPVNMLQIMEIDETFTTREDDNHTGHIRLTRGAAALSKISPTWVNFLVRTSKGT